jgi:hypothetical protein
MEEDNTIIWIVIATHEPELLRHDSVKVRLETGLVSGALTLGTVDLPHLNRPIVPGLRLRAPGAAKLAAGTGVHCRYPDTRIAIGPQEPALRC